MIVLTGLTALSTLLLAVATGLIAYSAHVNAQVAKLDRRQRLFEDRFAVYETVQRSIGAALRTGRFEDLDALAALGRAIDRSRFLFKSDLTQTLISYRDDLVALETCKVTLDDPDAAARDDATKQSNALVKRLMRAQQELHAPFRPYLDLGLE